jgi:hypothetical protein
MYIFLLTKKDNITKYMAFCGGGEKMESVQHVTKILVGILFRCVKPHYTIRT